MKYAIFVLGMTLLMLGGCAQQPQPLVHHSDCPEGKIYAMDRAECIDRNTLLDALEPYPVIFLGDQHKRADVHAFAASLIEGLSRRGYRVHLANEWFTPADNGVLSDYAASRFDDGNFTSKIGWKQKAGYDFSLYAPVYHAIQHSHGALYGVNLDKAVRKKISDANVTGMNKEEAAFYRALDLNVSAHRQMLEPYLDHCRHGGNGSACIERMYRVQVAWDTKMALESASLADEVLRTQRDKLIVFAGAMHFASHLGVNMRFSRRSNLPSVTILPVERDSEGYEHALAEFLYLYIPEPK